MSTPCFETFMPSVNITQSNIDHGIRRLVKDMNIANSDVVIKFLQHTLWDTGRAIGLSSIVAAFDWS